MPNLGSSLVGLGSPMSAGLPICRPARLIDVGSLEQCCDAPGDDPMKARDVMTTSIVSVDPDTPVGAIARSLSEHGISGVPVLDHSGAALGMVSEGDLIGRDEAAREARRDWWLTVLAEGEALSPEFLASLRTPERRARDVMAAPAITVGEDTDLG